MNMHGEIEFLGTGTSTGVPVIGCDCEVCCSVDAKDKRLRTSVVVRIGKKNILIDCGPDFREQMLRAKSSKLDLALLTHSHYDHVGGVDDLRPYCYPNNFRVFAQKNVLDDLVARVPYCFYKNPYPGVPQFNLGLIDTDNPVFVDGVKIEALPVWHHKLLINGYKIGEHLAYITDAKMIDDCVVERLRGVKVLVINALRIEPHLSHLSLAETLEIVSRINAEKTYLIHMSHDIGTHEEVSRVLPEGVSLAYDGLVVEF